MLLDRRITIQSATEAQDSTNQSVTTWSTFKECWATKNDKSGTEGMENYRDTATRLTEWWIRYDADAKPTEGMRILHDSRYYDIEVVTEIGRKDFFKLTTISKDVQN